MEFDLDVPAVTEVLRDEYASVRGGLAISGPAAVLTGSHQRHDERLRRATDAPSLACRAGCSWCCYFTVDIRAVEAFRIVDFIDRDLDEAERRRVRAEIEANRAILKSLDEDQRYRRNLKCPLLRDGTCVAYAVRPQSCRNYHATDADGCRRAFEDPSDVDIDPEFAPGVYQAGAAHVEGFAAALSDGGYDSDVYELNLALSAALRDPLARERFERREKPFLDLRGYAVESEFDDLWTRADEPR